MVRGPNPVLTPLKSASFEIQISSLVHSSKNLRLGWLYVGYESLQSYPSQTKIWEGRTNLSEQVFEALFNVL
jgi:hypothetical protein